MKKVLLTALLLSSSTAFADPTVFGLTIAETTVAQLKQTYRVSYSGENKYSHGDMYSINQGQIQFEGIGEVTAIFNNNGVLQAVLSNFNKSKFDYLNSVLSKKYQRVSQNVPFVGNKSATYKDGNTEISLDAPHMSFTMSMNYMTTEFLDAYHQQVQQEKNQQQQQESSML